VYIIEETNKLIIQTIETRFNKIPIFKNFKL